MEGSRTSVQSVPSVLDRVGSFLGISKQHSQLDLWQKRLKLRAQCGELGLHLVSTDYDENVVISHLEQAVSQASVWKNEDDFTNEAISNDSFLPVKQPTLEMKPDTFGSRVSNNRNEDQIDDDYQSEKRGYGTESHSTTTSSEEGLRSGNVSDHRRNTVGPLETTSTPALSTVFDLDGKTNLNISANAATQSRSSKVFPASDSSRSSTDRQASPDASEELKQRETLSTDNSEGFVAGVNLKPTNKGQNTPSPELWYGEEAIKKYRDHTKKTKKEKVIEITRRKSIVENEIKTKLERLERAITTVKRHYIRHYGRRSKSYVQRLKEWVCGTTGAESRPELLDFLSRSLNYHRTPGVPRYYAYFTYAICIINLLVFGVMTLANTPLATIGMEPEIDVDSFSTFRGSEPDICWKIPNVWIGIELPKLIKWGSVYAPCMRDDVLINVGYAAQGLADAPALGCCEVNVEGRRLAGTTTRFECERDTGGVGNWSSDIVCSERETIRSLEIPHRIKPCCTGMKGQCRMIVEEHCQFLRGEFYDSGSEHCSLVNCLGGVCGFSGLKSDSKHKYKPENANQQWRLLLGPLLHPGIIQVSIAVFLQLLIGEELEVVAGWLRVAIIYILSSVGGLAMGAAFSPYLPHMGAIAGIFGQMSALLLELVQSWKLVKHPFLELSKMLGIIGVTMAIGTLPLMDNWEIVGGLIFGGLISSVILPYITFGRWNVLQKKVIIAITVPVIVVLYVLILFLVYEVQNIADNCPSCKKFTCVSYTDNNCNIENLA